MDYNLVYHSFYNENYLKFEKIIKAKLVKSKFRKLSFGTVLVEIRNYLSADYLKKIRLRQDSRLENLYNIFNTRYILFDADHIEEVFKNKIDKEFKKLVIEYDYTIEDLILEIALSEVVNEIGRLLHNHSGFFEMFYKANDFEDFEIRDYGNIALQDTAIYKKLHRKIYPEYHIKNSSSPFENNQLGRLNNRKEKKNESEKQEFELDEQLLILNICLVDKNSIPLTERAKLIILIGEINEKTIFKESSANNLAYQKISKGILRKGSVNTMVEILDSVLKKIENFDLKITNQTLKKHRTTLSSEQNKAK